MNLKVINNRVDEILNKLHCSLCFQLMDVIYRTKTGLLQCAQCVKDEKLTNETVVIDDLWTNINNMFKELSLCLSNGEKVGDDNKQLPLKNNTHLAKKRKLARRNLNSSKNPQEIIDFFTNGAGFNFFKTRIESCLANPSEKKETDEASYSDKTDCKNYELGQPCSAKSPKEEKEEMCNEKKTEEIEDKMEILEHGEETYQDLSGNESEIDLFVPATPDQKLNQARKFFMGSALSAKSKTTLQQFARFFNGDIVENISQHFDCLFMENKTITLKYLYARCKNIPIVRFDWVVDSFAVERLLPLEPYKMNRENLEIPSLFQELRLILCPPFANYSNQDIMEVLKATGAKVCYFEEWQPELDELRLLRLLVGVSDTIPYTGLTLKSMAVKYRAPIVDISYFVTVLTSGKLKNIRNHLIVDFSTDDLIYLGFPERITIQTESDSESEGEEV